MKQYAITGQTIHSLTFPRNFAILVSQTNGNLKREPPIFWSNV